jgi:phosphoglycolate phosphatase
VAISAILLDKDGTLIDYWRTWLPINREVALFAAGGEDALARKLLLAGGQDPVSGRVEPGSVLAAGSVEDIARVFAAELGLASPARLSQGIEAIFRRGGAEYGCLVPGARETVGELRRRGFRLGLATNDSIGGLEASLARHAILDLFDFTVGCDSGFGAKPDPRMVLAFCASIGVVPSGVAVVGDAPHDLSMGRAAGVGLTLGVLGGTSARQDLEPFADRILQDVNDLLRMPEFAAAAQNAAMPGRTDG